MNTGIMRILGAVIAGGKSTRMGGKEKSLLTLGGRPVLAHILSRLSPQVDGLLINANGDPSRFSQLGVPVVGDDLRLPALPLTGLLACLEYAAGENYDFVLSVTSDTPFIPTDFCTRLQPSPPAMARSAAHDHYLCGLWPVTLGPALRSQLQSRVLRSAKDFGTTIGAVAVEWSASPFDPFMNINKPEDFNQAEQILEERSLTQKVIGVAGFKNSGKTTLVEKLVRELTGRGYRISTVKHAHHSFDIDHEGRDSFRHRKAGATEVAVVSKSRWALIHESREEEAPSLSEVLAKLAPCDLIIIEGYKRDFHDKIEVRNLALSVPELAKDDPTIVAIAATGEIEGAGVPVFDRDDVEALAEFIIAHMGLNKTP